MRRGRRGGVAAGLLAMTEQAVQNINLNVCKKLDNGVTKVIATASHVVMYSLEDNQHWVYQYRPAQCRCCPCCCPCCWPCCHPRRDAATVSRC